MKPSMEPFAWLVVKEYSHAGEMIVYTAKTEAEAREVKEVLEKQRADGCFAVVAVTVTEKE